MANLSLVISISSPPSTEITLTPAAPFSGSGTSFSAAGAVAAGVTVGTLAVAPEGWQGALALGGADADSFSLSGMNLVTATALPGGVHNVTVTSTP
jgi:hypothetical protein